MKYPIYGVPLLRCNCWVILMQFSAMHEFRRWLLVTVFPWERAVWINVQRCFVVFSGLSLIESVNTSLLKTTFEPDEVQKSFSSSIIARLL